MNLAQLEKSNLLINIPLSYNEKLNTEISFLQPSSFLSWSVCEENRLSRLF